jgi:hypothetical protein
LAFLLVAKRTQTVQPSRIEGRNHGILSGKTRARGQRLAHRQVRRHGEYDAGVGFKTFRVDRFFGAGLAASPSPGLPATIFMFCGVSALADLSGAALIETMVSTMIEKKAMASASAISVMALP